MVASAAAAKNIPTSETKPTEATPQQAIPEKQPTPPAKQPTPPEQLPVPTPPEKSTSKPTPPQVKLPANTPPSRPVRMRNKAT